VTQGYCARLLVPATISAMSVGPKAVLITGASGYLGQHLLSSLCENTRTCAKDEDASPVPFRIVAAYGSLDSFAADFASSDLSENSSVSVTLVGGVDLSDRPCVESLFATHGPFDCVVNLAAVSSPGVCQKSPELAQAVNCPAPLVDALRDATDTCIIHLSTDQVYAGTDAPYKETDEARPVHVYGDSKVAFEKELLRKFPSSAVALRSSLILGPPTPFRCRKQTFLQFVEGRLTRNEETMFYTDEYRSVVYVGDVIRVIRHFLESGIGDQDSGVYNMGGSDSASRLDIVDALAKQCDFDSGCARGVERASLPPGDVPSPLDISMDISKLTNVTGIKFCGLDEIIRRTFPKSKN